MRAGHRQGGDVGGCSSSVVGEINIVGSGFPECRRTHTFRISAGEAVVDLPARGRPVGAGMLLCAHIKQCCFNEVGFCKKYSFPDGDFFFGFGERRPPPRSGTLTLTITQRHAWLLCRGVVMLGNIACAGRSTRSSLEVGSRSDCIFSPTNHCNGTVGAGFTFDSVSATIAFQSTTATSAIAIWDPMCILKHLSLIHI